MTPIRDQLAVWQGHFRVCAFFAAIIDLSVDRRSRKNLEPFISAVRYCVAQKECHEGMDFAMTMLWRLIAGGDDFVPLVRALRLGLLPLLRDVSRTLPACDMHRLASHVAAAAHFPSVLRVIRSQLRTIPSDGDSTGKASLGRWIRSYGELLVEIKRAEEVARTAPQFWKVRYKCHGTMVRGPLL